MRSPTSVPAGASSGESRGLVFGGREELVEEVGRKHRARRLSSQVLDLPSERLDPADALANLGGGAELLVEDELVDGEHDRQEREQSRNETASDRPYGVHVVEAQETPAVGEEEAGEDKGTEPAGDRVPIPLEQEPLGLAPGITPLRRPRSWRSR